MCIRDRSSFPSVTTMSQKSSLIKTPQYVPKALTSDKPCSAACALPHSIAGHLGRLDEARGALDEMQRRQPGITIGFVRDHIPVTVNRRQGINPPLLSSYVIRRNSALIALTFST